MILYIIISVLTFLIGFLLGRTYKQDITIHNEDDIKKGMELERRYKKLNDYLDDAYTIYPVGYVEEKKKQIRKEVLGHY